MEHNQIGEVEGAGDIEHDNSQTVAASEPRRNLIRPEGEVSIPLQEDEVVPLDQNRDA